MSAALRTVDLPPEAISLIKAATPKPQVERPRMAEGEGGSTGANAVSEAVSSLRTLAVSSTGKPLASDTAPIGGLAHLSVRLPADVPMVLLRASMERKLARQEPWTQQQIVAEALTLWLKKHGYAV